MHIWGDEWFEKHGNELYAAEEYICKYVKRWSGCILISKEKYGTLRYEWVFPPWTRRGQFSLPKWLITCSYVEEYRDDDRVVYGLKYELGSGGKSPVIIWRWCDSWLYGKWCKFGEWTLTRAIKKAIIKFPNVKEEILDDL